MPTSRTLAIGDIHGCLSQLNALLAAISLSAEDHLIFLGDYVDRGANSAGVLSRIVELSRQFHLTPLMGNHEELMLAARQEEDHLIIWKQFGGGSTLASYSGERLLKHVPHEHWQFLESLHPFAETDNHIFVHAGITSNLAMELQPPEIRLWQTFQNAGRHLGGKTVICGHTIQSSGMPGNRGYAICIDTGAGSGGPLTCLDVNTGEFWQADAQGAITHDKLPVHNRRPKGTP